MAEIYKLSEKTKQLMVDGLRQGFVEFIEEKAKKKEEMKVSSGYAWTRGNHIDNEIDRRLNEANIAISKVFKSSGWEFLRFTLNEDDHKIWIVQKAAYFIQNKDNFAKKDDKRQNLISQWGNNVNSKYKKLFSGDVKNIILLDDDFDERDDINEFFSKQLDEAEAFYLLTYEISKDNDISSIKLNMIFDGKVKMIEDLGDLNAASQVKIPEEIRGQLENNEVINPKFESGTEYKFYTDATVKEDKEKKNINKK